MQVHRRTLRFSAALLGCLFLLAGSLSQASIISATTDALGISWTLTATDEDVADYDIMFSLQADIPSDLSLIMDEGETISPTWIASAEARVVGLEEFMLVAAPNGIAGWYDLSGPSANSCQDVSDGSACAEANSDSTAAEITAGASHVWTWVGNVTDLEAVFAADLSGLQHIGAHLENDGHRNGWNVSEEFGQPIPEPSAALVFGVGIAFVGTRLRRTTRLS